MKVLFAEPPPEQAVGGLSLAIDTLDAYLNGEGVQVKRNAGYADLWDGPRPDIVHFHGLWQPLHGWLSHSCRRWSIRYVVSPHGMLEPWAWQHKQWKKKPYYGAVERGHINGAGCILATSTQEETNLQPFISGNRVEMIPLALQNEERPDFARARRSLGWREDERVLVYLSRVHPKKGLDLLLEALTTLDDAARNILRLVIVGSGPESYLTELRRFQQIHYQRLPLIEWVGPVWGEKKWKYLQGADLMCLPTYSENFGYVVLEACQVGTPVLTTTTTPWSFLEAWGAGYIVDPAVPALGDALLRFVNQHSWDTRRRERLAQQTRERFSMAVLGPRYLQLYVDLASREDRVKRSPLVRSLTLRPRRITA